MAGPLNPEDINYFNTQRRRVRTTYDLGLQQNTFNRQLATTKHGQNVGDLTYKYDQMRQQLPGGYAKRGLFNSGIYQRGLIDFNRSKLRDFGNLTQMHNQQLAGFTLANDQLARLLAESSQDVDQAEAARKAAVEAILAARG